MNVIKIDLENLSDANELLNLADSNENIDVIQEKNFNGDITTLELYISMTLNVIALIVPVLIKLIKGASENWVNKRKKPPEMATSRKGARYVKIWCCLCEYKGLFSLIFFKWAQLSRQMI